MILEYLPISREDVFNKPQKTILDIKGTLYQINVSYNNFDKGFYFSMYRDVDKLPIIEGRKVVFGQDLLSNIICDCLPGDISIVVVNTTENIEESRVTKDNFMVEIKPYLIVGGSNG